MDKNKDIGVLGSWAEIFPDKKLVKPAEDFAFLNVFIFSPWLIHSSIMMRNEIIKKNQIFYNSGYIPAEDYALWSQLVRITKIQNLQEVLVKYRAGEGISFKRRQEMIHMSAKIQQELLDFLTTNPILQKRIKKMLSRCKKVLKHPIRHHLYKLLYYCTFKSSYFSHKKAEEKENRKYF